MPRHDPVEAGGAKRRSQQPVLVSAQFDDDPSASPQEPPGTGDHAPHDVEPVGAAVERGPRFVTPDIGGQERQSRGGDVRCDRSDEIEPAVAESGPEITQHDEHPVAPSARRCPTVDVDADHGRVGRRSGEVDGDRPRAGAQVHRPTARGEQLARPAGELLALRSGHVHPGVHEDGPVTELSRAGEPGQRLTVFASRRPRLEGLLVGRRSDEVHRLFFGGDEAGPPQALARPLHRSSARLHRRHPGRPAGTFKASAPGADALEVSEPEVPSAGSARRARPKGPRPGSFDARPGEVASTEEPLREVWFKDSGRVVVAPADARWTFHPDEAQGEDPGPVSGEAEPRLEQASEPHGRGPRVAVVGMVVSLIALVAGILGATRTWPFHSSPPAAASPSHAPARPQDIRGTWDASEVFSGTSVTETLEIQRENLTTGSFSGTVRSPVGIERVHGTVNAATVSFAITFGNTTISGTASVAGSHGHLSMVGNFSNALGSRGLIVATRATP